MAIMKTDVTLRVEPNGKRGSVIARGRDKVDVLGTQEVDVIGGGKESWTKIQLPDADGVPQGWVPSDRVDPAGEPPAGPIDMHKFARQCWWERIISDVNPYYLVAVAELRSQVSGGRDGDNVGPFRLTQAEWDAGRTDAQFRLGEFRGADIADWRMQCVMFAQMESRGLEALTSALTRQPSWVELYLAQMIGPKAAAAAIKSPDDTVEKAFANAQAGDFPPGGLTRDQLLDRYAKFLRDPPPPVAAVKGQVALDRIAVDLQAALNKVRATVDAVGNEFLDNEPIDASLGNVGGTIPSGTGGSGRAPFKSKAPGIMQRLMDKFHLSDIQAAGILGNIGVECAGFRHFQEGGKISPNGGWGWCQWTGTRRTDFETFRNGLNPVPGPKSDEANYGFLEHELLDKNGEGKVLRDLKKASKIGNATRIFREIYERAGVHADNERISFAETALHAFRQSKAQGKIS